MVFSLGKFATIEDLWLSLEPFSFSIIQKCVCVVCVCVCVCVCGGGVVVLLPSTGDIVNHPIVHRTGSPTTIIWSRMSVGLRLRNLVLVGFVFYLCQTV